MMQLVIESSEEWKYVQYSYIGLDVLVQMNQLTTWEVVAFVFLKGQEHETRMG